MTMTDSKTIERLPVNEAFARPANRAAIERAAAALRLRNFDARIVADAAEAREMVLALLPEGAEVGEGASITLDQIGVTEIAEAACAGLAEMDVCLDEAGNGDPVGKIDAFLAHSPGFLGV